MSDNIEYIDTDEMKIELVRCMISQPGTVDEKRKLLDDMYEKHELSYEVYFTGKSLLNKEKYQEMLEKKAEYEVVGLISKEEYEAARRKAIKEWTKEATKVLSFSDNGEDPGMDFAVECLLMVETFED